MLGLGEQTEVIFFEPVEPNEYGNTNKMGVTIFADIVDMSGFSSMVIVAVLVVVFTFAVLAAIVFIRKRKKEK